LLRDHLRHCGLYHGFVGREPDAPQQRTDQCGCKSSKEDERRLGGDDDSHGE